MILPKVEKNAWNVQKLFKCVIKNVLQGKKKKGGIFGSSF